jgi:CHASE2 domain-containing sensor protein
MKKFWIQCTAITVFVFLMLWGASGITDLKVFNAFDPISQALTDFELTDYAFSKLRPDLTVDTTIVIVNLAPTRALIAQQVNFISQLKPKVIGIDSFFNCEGNLYDSINCPQLLDTLGNLLLGSAIEEAGNVVLVSKVLQKMKTANLKLIDVYDSIEYSDPIIKKGAKMNAFANLSTGADYQEDVKLCRSFIPTLQVNSKDEYAFAVSMAMLYDSIKTKRFLKRGKEEEIINYRGNVEIQDIKLKSLQGKDLGATNFSAMFYAVDWDKLLAGEVAGDLFKDRIVIMGAMGSNFGDPAWTDKYFTPLNKKVAGRANPDMFGVVVHANIVAMILNQDFVTELTDWQKYFIAFLVCFLTVALFIFIDAKLPAWFDALSVIIQISQILAFSFLMVEVFASFSYKLDLSITLGVSALVGPCYDIFKSFQNEINNRLTKRRELVSKQQSELA